MGRLLGPADHARARRSIAVAAALVMVLIPAVVAAHPLGNFTINHYAEVRIEPDRVLLDIVIDQAEIAAFQARQDFDLDADGSVSDEEIEAGRGPACDDLAVDLDPTVDGTELELHTIEAGLSFPPGVGGLSTLRLVCGFEAPLGNPMGADPTRVAFADLSYPNRLGWREIVVRGSGVTLRFIQGEPRETSVSGRLTSYPPELTALPLADQVVEVDATAGGPELPPFDIPDAEPLDGAAPPASPEPSASPSTSASPAPSVAPSPTPAVGAVPGGVGDGELPEIFRQDLTPVVVLLSLLSAAALGIGHALTPGHGKTLMAAYLVGTRGTPLHAIALALSVTVSHTVGILILAALIVGASDVLPPDVVVGWAPLVAAVSIVVIGGWMLVGELRRRRSVRSSTAVPAHGHDDHGHAHEHEHDFGPEAGADHDHGLEHDHGGLTHSHAPVPGSTITWRSLFALGLVGGLIPSTSALLILLGSIAAGRPAFGFVLVVAFGLGMAAVLGGIGLALVVARTRLDRVPDGGGLGRVRDAVPLVASVLVLGLGVYLTAQALGSVPSL
jgi:nickel/cobalt transporter (NicO) family protein